MSRLLIIRTDCSTIEILAFKVIVPVIHAIIHAGIAFLHQIPIRRGIFGQRLLLRQINDIIVRSGKKRSGKRQADHEEHEACKWRFFNYGHVNHRHKTIDSVRFI